MAVPSKTTRTTAKTPRARHRRFLAAGFFPPEVPPCFYSEQLARFRNSLLGHFSQLPNINGKPNFYFRQTRKTAFHFPRFRSADRQHSIVDPIAYFFLSKILADNHVKLNKLTKKSRISGSPSIFDWSGSRALQRPNFNARDRLASQASARFEYVVTADIRAFYHSIYTHSIAWAIHSKRIAKKNHSDALVGNLIDRLSRNLQDGQTIGIPVGPDTSRLVAELVGAAIDVEIQKKVKNLRRRGMRFVDDFTLGCEDRPSAETAIAAIRRAANEFELDLNSAKTSISWAASAPAGGWKIFLRSFIPAGMITTESLEIFFFRVSELAKQMPEVNVERYAIQNARRAIVECPTWSVAESYLISAYKLNSTLINLLVELFVARQLKYRDVELQTVTSFIETRLPLLCEQRRNGEAAWLLFLANALNIKIKARSVEPFCQENDPLVALLISDAEASARVVGSVDHTIWNRHLKTDSLDEEMWLYAYEATLKNLTAASAGDAFIRQHPYFARLYEKKIEFYRSSHGVLAIHDILHRRRLDNAAVRRVTADFDVDFSFDIDEIDEEVDETDY